MPVTSREFLPNKILIFTNGDRPCIHKEKCGCQALATVFRIRIHRIHMLLGLPDPDLLVRCMDPDPDPSIINQK
jgi:hypothetical protein